MSIVQHLDKIAVFTTIVESGSLHAASRRLGVSQPALTQTIKTLEKAAGCQLIVRGREGVGLTAQGQILYKSSLHILKEAYQVEEELGGTQTGQRNRVRVGIFESIAIYAWPKAQKTLLKLIKQHGLAQSGFDLYTGRTDQLLKRLGAAEIDIAVVVDPVISPLQIQEFLFNDSFFLYCSPDEPDRPLIEAKHSGLLQTLRPLFLFESARISENRDLKASISESPLQFETINRVDSFEVATEFVRAGLGFALLPERVAEKNFKGLHKVKIGDKAQEPVANHRIYAVAAKTTGFSLAFKLLCDALKSS